VISFAGGLPNRDLFPVAELKAAAKALGLDFIPLLPERYDLVVPETTFVDPRFQVLLAVIRSPECQEAAAALGGYDLKDCGRIVWEQ
jgi:molybdopterin molybdotransferase/putative molybdopterin biosynthesis protein